MSRFSRAFLDELLGRTSILEVVGRKVTWDKRKSQPARGDMWACCPFHNEKSPSFHAVDARGIYKCFGCGEAGNALDFVMKTENLPFLEAVERLAADAGMALPARDPAAEERVDADEKLIRALAAARAAFEQALTSSDGAKARAYLEKRAIPPSDWARFGLGWAPNSRTWLKDRLTQGGHALADLVSAGLLRAPDDGGAPYDAFRGRLMFPIEDGRGRTVSFGARTLDPDGQPKYLNGPESPVFHKGRTLYRLKEARAGARDRPILVAEGYVDVIALERAGFPAVAPLGTALTEDQIQLVWKASRRPVLCFDGDAAGRKAASRALDRALPLVTAERSLAFAFLPEGRDPDDLIRAGGPAAMNEAVAAALPLGAYLFERERDLEPLTTAEARAGLRKRLRALVRQTPDPDLRAELGEEVKVRLDALFARASSAPRGDGRAGDDARGRTWTPGRGRAAPGDAPALPPTSELKARMSGAKRRPPRALLDIVAAPLRAPDLLDAGLEAFATLTIADRGLDSLRHALLDVHHSGSSIEIDEVRRHLLASESEDGVRALDEARRGLVNPFVKAGDDGTPTGSADRWIAAMERHEARRALEEDAAEAVSAAAAGDDEGFERLMRVVAERRSLAAETPGDG